MLGGVFGAFNRCFDLATALYGKTVAGGGGLGRAGEVKLWDAATGQLRADLPGLEYQVEGLAFTRDGLELFIDQAPNQALLASVESHCGRSDAATRRLAALLRRGDAASLPISVSSLPA